MEILSTSILTHNFSNEMVVEEMNILDDVIMRKSMGMSVDSSYC